MAAQQSVIPPATAGIVSRPWDPTTLAIGGAMLSGRVPPPDLTGPVHPLFARDRWEIDEEDYLLLLPSMRLATRLLEVGMPYMANFLPSSKIYGTPQDVSHAEHSHLVSPEEISLSKIILLKDLQETELELEAIAKCIKWRLNERMHANYHWNGITRLADHGEADFVPLEENDIREADLEAAQAGRVRRPLVIAIMDLLLVPMRTHPTDSEIRLKAQFMAAITMVHEIGHAIFHQDYRSFNPGKYGEYGGEEPYVGEDVDRELGRSFVSWIFNGFHPQFCESHEKDAQFGSLGWSLYWEPLHKIDEIFEVPTALNPIKDKEHKRPLYEKISAIPVEYLSNTFRQSWWEANQRGIPLYRLAAFLRMRLKMPPEDKLGAATSVKANWWVHPIAKHPRWKGHYRIMKFSLGQPVEGLTYNQVVSQMKLEGQRFSFALHDEEDDYDDEIDRLSREHTPREGQEIFPGYDDDRAMIAYSVETQDDGMLDEDIGVIEDDDAEVVTRIEVRYRPTTDFQPRSTKIIPPNKLVEEAQKEVRKELAAEEKAAASEMFAGSGPRPGKRGNSSDSLLIHGPSKRLRTIVEADKIDQSATFHEKTIKALDRASANEIGHWTRIQAWYYCSQHGLALPELPSTAAAQQAKLDNGTEAGYNLMRKIQYHLLQTLWKEIYIDGRHPESVVLTAKYILSLIDFFSAEDIDSMFYIIYKVDQVDLSRKREMCKAYFKKQVRYFPKNVRNRAAAPTVVEPLPALHALAPEPAQWSEDDLRSWCRHKGIPQWGSISGLIARVNRFREEEKIVKVGIAGRPKPPPGRADRTGTETYYFSAVLRHSSLDALKSSLFIAGNFPSDTELDLWVNTDEILQPGPLNKQIPTVDWKRLVLRASRTAIHKEPIKISREERIERIRLHNSLIEDQLREVQRNPDKEILPDFEERIIHKPGSVLNKVTDISRRALALTRIRTAPGTLAGQSYKKHDRPNLIKGRHLDDMIMDLEDLQMRRRQELEKSQDWREKRKVEENERAEKEQRRATHMKLLSQRFTKDYGVGTRLGVGEEEVKEEAKGEVEDEWQEDYV
ncbi:hypothetical protein SBOR_0543 [Sclerotinia borealis F-4128]|uniref:Uncharacterized protein n=1 Tax=Sclerotinia borealis (strain F-4128) TaxID=1432307 RepID=W9CSM9_SCLBF|nr:hypothetical protein SBOR_0543 [Sclerotinia borealis F-4128]